MKELASIEFTKQQQQQQNSTPVVSIPSSEQLFTITNQELPTSSFQVTLTNDENDKTSTLNSILTNKIVNQTIQPNTIISVQGKTRSAFRPFLKSVRFNQDTFSAKQQLPTTDIPKPVNPPQQQQISNTNVPYQSPPKRTNTTQPIYPSLNMNSLVSIVNLIKKILFIKIFFFFLESFNPSTTTTTTTILQSPSNTFIHSSSFSKFWSNTFICN